MDVLIEDQRALHERICRTMTNFKKLGVARMTRAATTARIKTLELQWTQFQETHREIRAKATSTDRERPYFEEDLLGIAEEAYTTAHGELLEHLESLATASTDAQPTAPATTSARSYESSTARRVPRITMPKFSGEYVKWPSFRDIFVAMVGSNRELTNVEKLHYLKTNVSGEPEQLTRNIPTTDGNFQRAWDKLCHTYEHKAQLVKAHLEVLLAIAPVAVESADELKRLLNTTVEVLDALRTLERPVDTWDDLIVHLSVGRLDNRSRRAWELSRKDSREPSTFPEFVEFLETRIRAVEFIPSSQAKEKSTSRTERASTDNRGKSGKSTNARTHHVAAKPPQCPLCNADHFLRSCPSYTAHSPEERQTLIEARHLCMNCLGSHLLPTCRSPRRCRNCGGKHHTSLHRGSAGHKPESPSALRQTETSGQTTSPNVHFNSDSQAAGPSHVHHAAAFSEEFQDESATLLATALVVAVASNGETKETRVLLDQGSQVNLISEYLAQRLRLPRRQTPFSVYGMESQIPMRTTGLVTVEVSSRFDLKTRYRVDAHVVPRMSGYLPTAKIYTKEFPHLRDLQLADPALERPHRIELLFGARTFARLLRTGVRLGTEDIPLAQETALGWILSGPSPSQPSEQPTIRRASSLHCTADRKVHDLLQQFWLQEEAPTRQVPLNPDELACEQHFAQTHQRLVNGRYVVRLPLNDRIKELGSTMHIATNVLSRLERRLKANERLRTSYTAFLEEYEALGHMAPVVSPSEPRSEPIQCYYLPHHGIIKESSSTTKLRVVFNASQPSDSSVSLNDCLHVGQKLQTELPDVVTRWRRHSIVFAADIEKMYRQIWVASEDQDFQRILWRRSSNETPQAFRLTTVTYGVNCAPYLALRTLQQLAHDDGPRFPVGAEVLRTDIYVDDVLSGANDLSTAIEKQVQLGDLLKAGGFNLHKWVSNDPELLSRIPEESRETVQALQFEDNSAFKLLGLRWRAHTDTFGFQVQAPRTASPTTKRSVLSSTAQLFDPLGWLAPVVIKAKIFLQTLWVRGCGWDESLPDALAVTWQNFHASLTALGSVSVPRWLGLSTTSQSVELHGFCDASERAYAAVIYLRVDDANGIRITLVSAKTKVAPLKKISLPRLELSAATLLARMISHAKDVLDLGSIPIYLWSDSMITLDWIRQPPARWKTFVANRTSEVQTLVPQAQWRHVPGIDNPADCASRGILPSELPSHTLWWKGPAWLLARSHWVGRTTSVIR